MSQRKVQFSQGGFYYVYNRGTGRQLIFRQERNYHYLLRLLKQVAAVTRVTVIAYCLLPSQYHWLVRQDGDTPAGQVPARVCASYTQAFNTMYGRSGRLFEGPCQAIVVEHEADLRQLCRYIHANPVRHRLVSRPEDWPYSNYLEWLERRPGNLVDLGWVREMFGPPQQYEAYVAAYLAGLDLPEDPVQRPDG